MLREPPPKHRSSCFEDLEIRSGGYGLCGGLDAGGVNTKEALLDGDGLPTDATQGAWLVLTAEALPERDRRVRASPMSWRSSKLKRNVFSTLGGETQAMLQGVNEVEWMQVMYIGMGS